MDGPASSRAKGGWPFPNWRGEIVVVAGSGPSQAKEDLEAAQGKARLIAINETWQLAPWADALYGCDERWWRARGPRQFTGLRFQGFIDTGGALVEGCIHAGVIRGVDMLMLDGEHLGAGGNSGFQALNLAVATGAARIILLGFDMQIDGGVHWHGRHGKGMTNPDAPMLRNCARILDEQAPLLDALGIEVVNASRRTALKAYRRATIEEALG